MSSPGDVTRLLLQLQEGNRAAAEPLWELYFRRLLGLARDRLRGCPRTAADEEDVALSAFDSFCRRAEAGQFPHLQDRDDLWHLLVTIVTRKACNLAEHEGREKRDFRRKRSAGEEETELAGAEPDPALAAELVEQFDRLLGLLPSEE